MSFRDALLEVGLNEEKCDSKPEVSDEDKPFLTKILLALSAAKKGHELLAKSADMFQDVVMKVPNVKQLSTLFNSASNYDPQTMSEARSRCTKYKQASGPGGVKNFRPKKISSSEFLCRLCGHTNASWTGCDSHIRKTHSKIYYQCHSCSYRTSNQDQIRRHEKECK